MIVEQDGQRRSIAQGMGRVSWMLDAGVVDRAHSVINVMRKTWGVLDGPNMVFGEWLAPMGTRGNG